MYEDWFTRLSAAIEAHQDSRRAISLRAGLSDTYVHQMLTYEKHPTVSKFVALCRAIDANPVEILTGIKQDEASAAIQSKLGQLSEQQKNVFLSMLDSFQAAVGDAQTGRLSEPQLDQNKFSGPRDEPLEVSILDRAAKQVRLQEKSLTDAGLFNIEEYEKRLKAAYNEIYEEEKSLSDQLFTKKMKITTN